MQTKKWESSSVRNREIDWMVGKHKFAIKLFLKYTIIKSPGYLAPLQVPL